jgi:hypothetical protein
MKLLLATAAVGAGLVALWWLWKGRSARPSETRTPAEAASALLSLGVIVAAAYVAHRVGVFALPLVVLAFLPVAVATRWILHSTRESRERLYAAGGAAPSRIQAGLVLPFMAVLAVAAAVLGVAVGMLVGPN